MTDARPEVDVTLIDELLELSPEERIRQNDRTLTMIEELRNGIARATQPAGDAGSKPR